MTNLVAAVFFLVLAISALAAGRARLRKGPRRVPLGHDTDELELLERWPRVYFGLSLVFAAGFLIAASAFLVRLL